MTITLITWPFFNPSLTRKRIVLVPHTLVAHITKMLCSYILLCKIICLNERFMTCIILLFSCTILSFFVSYQITWPKKRLITYITLMISNSIVNYFVTWQIPRLTKNTITYITLMFFNGTVNFFVFCQMTWPTKCLMFLTPHLCFLFPWWIILCLDKETDKLYALLHISHLCILME